MRRRTGRPAVLLALIGVAFGASRPAGAGIDDPARAARLTRLANGLTVLTLEDRSTPVVSFQMWVQVGSKDESRFSGLAHLFEHLMFRGSARLAPEAHARLIEARGGRVNAFTNRDVTVYFEDVAPDTLPLVIDLEGERVAHLRLVHETLESERQVVLEERRMRVEDSPEGRVFEALLAQAFAAHPYRRPVIGWRSDVAAVDVQAARRFFHTYYAPNNIVIAVVGNFDADRVRARIARAFGGLEPAAAIPRNPTREPAQDGERRAVVHFDVQAPILAAAWHAPAAGSPDVEPLEVAGRILSGGRSSRLYRRLVHDTELALVAEGDTWQLQEAGLFYAFVRVRPNADPNRVERVLFEEIARMRDGSVSNEELARAKRQLEVSLVRGLETSHALAFRIAHDTVFFGRIRPLSERLAAVDAVTAADVRRVAQTYLRPDAQTVVRLVAPPSGREASR